MSALHYFRCLKEDASGTEDDASGTEDDGSGTGDDGVRLDLLYRNTTGILEVITDSQGNGELTFKEEECVFEGTRIYVPRSELGSQHGIVREITPFLDSLVPERWHENFIEELTPLVCPRDGDLKSVASLYKVLLLTMTMTEVEVEGEEPAGYAERAAWHEDDPCFTVFRPATWSLLRSLETVPEDKLDVEDCCAICTDNYGVSKGVGSSEAVLLPCKHTYHRSCITKWLRRNHLCPLCRFEMPHEVVVYW